MATPAWAGYTNAILAACKASSSFTDVDIFDGFEVKADNLPKGLVIGNDGVGQSQGVAGSFIANFKTIGARRMEEEGLLHCYLYANSGDTDSIGDCRQIASAMLSNFDTLLRSDVSLSHVVQYSGIHDASIMYISSTKGNAVKISFSIHYTAIT